jgi:predicted phage-related endonuclease
MNYNEIAQNNLDEIMKELAEYTRMAEEIAATVDSLKDVLKSHMEQCGVDTIAGTEHKATYKAVASSRIDTAALKRDKPDIATAYTRATETKRFLFV